jgi:hypothetical protein
MKWLLLTATLVAAAFAIQILIADTQRVGRRSTLGRLAIPVLSLMALAAAIYAAHAIGFFSVPIVALAFVPFGLALRWSLLANRGMRERREAASQPVQRSGRDRLVGLAMWPLFFVLVVLVAAIGLVTGFLAGQR